MSINAKYFDDIKKFPLQFAAALTEAEQVALTVGGQPRQAVLCGMGGSSLYGDLVNQLLDVDLVKTHSGYGLPATAHADDLYIVASYSGNTEETLSSLEELLARGFKQIVVFTAGGKLAELAKANNLPMFTLPGGIQPRLSTGYFIGYTFFVLKKYGLIQTDLAAFAQNFANLETNLDLELAKRLAQELVDKTAIVYGDQSNWSIAKIVKIKFNENAKVQAFWNFFPELNHNEMVGYSKLTANPYFLILKSKFGHERNAKRMDVFAGLLREKGCTVQILELPGQNKVEEMFSAYFLADHITYFLAEAYGIDPEPVEMVEQFKKML
jgi:glucose/mannose-6-phosphate isomerase